jgi:hypothetical protein
MVQHSPSKQPIDYQVVFQKSKGDRQLKQAIDQFLLHQPEISFSELCKQALKQYLIKEETSAAVLILLDLQQQITEIQGQCQQLDTQLTIQAQQSQQDVQHLETRLAELEGHLQTLKHRGIDTVVSNPLPEASISLNAKTVPEETPVEAVESVVEIELEDDPLLSRLGPLLDGF